MATLIAPNHFSPIEDAQNVKKACLGLGTDEKTIISVLGHRNAAQRKLIRLAYDELYQEDLIQQLKSELSGNFEKAITLWTLEPADRDAILANAALKRSEPDYKEILEMACIRSPEELLEVKRAYRIRYKHSLEEDVASHTTGDIRRLLVAIISCYKYDGDELDEKLSHLEANIVYDEIHSNTSVHEELIRILSTRSKAQLCSTFNAYKDIYHSSITKALSAHPADAYLAALRAAIRCTKNPQRYFAKVLRNAIKDPGTDEDAISRVITTRAETDLKDISLLFMKRNNISLEDAVTKSTSGDYKDFLLALLGRD